MAYLVRQLFWVLSSFTIFQPLILLHRLEDKRMFAFRIAARISVTFMAPFQICCLLLSNV